MAIAAALTWKRLRREVGVGQTEEFGFSRADMPTDEQIHEAIAEMLLAFEGTYDEIWTLHCRLLEDQELYLQAWSLLDAPFRRHWTAYLDDYRRSLNEGFDLPRPF